MSRSQLKQKKWPKLLGFALLSTALQVSCSGPESESPDALIGSYVARVNGQTREVIRIEKRTDGYFLHENNGTKWLAPEPMRPFGKDDFQRMLGTTAPNEFVGLATGVAAVLKVPRGWRRDQFETKTGYFAITVAGPVELDKK